MREGRFISHYGFVVSILIVSLSNSQSHASKAVRLHPVLGADQSLGHFAISPNGRHFVVEVDTPIVPYVNDHVAESLFSVSIVDGSVTSLTGTPENPFSLTLRYPPPQITLDSKYVIFSAAGANLSQQAVFRVPINGGAPVRLTDFFAVGPGGFNGVEVRTLTPDGTRAILVANEGRSLSQQVFVVPVAGGATVKLSPQLDPSEYVRGVQVTPDSSGVIFASNHLGGVSYRLFLRRFSDDNIVDLSGPYPGIDPSFTRLSADGRFAVFSMATQRSNLISVEIESGRVTRLNDILPSWAEVLRGAIVSPDSNWVAYRSDMNSDNQYQWFSVPIDSGKPTQVSSSLSPGEFILQSEGGFSFDSKYFVYAVGGNGAKLYSTPVTGGPPILLSPNGSVNSTFGNIRVAENSNHVLYQFDDGDGQINLFANAIPGGQLRWLNETVAQFGNVSNYAMSPEGNSIVFSTDNIQRLFISSLDGFPRAVNLGSLALDRSIDGVFYLNKSWLWVSLVDGVGAQEMYAVQIPEPRTLLGFAIVIAYCLGWRNYSC